jgi:hypothetical protein
MTFSQIGGTRLGFLNATWPFANLAANSDELTLRVFVIKFTFPKASVAKVSEYSGFVSSGLRIEHRNKNAPSFIVFWTPHSSALLKQLASMGYQTN